MTPHRIAYVVNTFPKLSETFIAEELAELRRRGLKVLILSLNRPTEQVRHDVVTRKRLLERTVYDPSTFQAALRRFRPELLHAHFATKPVAAARKLAAKRGIPFTFTAHGYDIHRRPPADFAARALASAALITVSEANAHHIVTNLGVPARHIQVIPCGIDIKRFRPGGERPGLPHIVCVARLVPVKNLGLLLQGCEELRRRGMEFRCVIVGDGECRDALIAERERRGLHGIVEFAGAAEQAQVIAWWRRASVAVLTSEREGMPVSLMEAAACGVPTVSTAVGGVPELVEDGVTGLLVPPNDCRELASALERLLHDPVLAARLGEQARQRATKRFSIKHSVDRLLGVWERVLRREEESCPSP